MNRVETQLQVKTSTHDMYTSIMHMYRTCIALCVCIMCDMYMQ